ncbi:MAG: hypothetical protein QOD02_5706 [Mycobacterium sp.]|jgi:hypothetical protein|nr:hypothetical protein [Mycobacterium sp.]MDT5278456.1 hypothetical protein [Mycobacterium sp.]MDT5307780.1 hypothetical protein [Mycobacterium sp.]
MVTHGQIDMAMPTCMSKQRIIVAGLGPKSDARSAGQYQLILRPERLVSRTARHTRPQWIYFFMR